jgi:acetyltransferase-like isoleucine patch superfamily enzyme
MGNDLPEKRDHRWAIVSRIEERRTNIALAYFAARAGLSAAYWGVDIGAGCSFYGPLLLNRVGGSDISVGSDCVFRSSYRSNQIGVNRPCMLSTLRPGAALMIGDGCGLSGTVISAAERVVLGKGVRCGANVTITDTDWHSPESPDIGPEEASHAPVVIEDGAWLGLNVVVLKGVTIGSGSVVAAGSVVVESVPPRVVVAGQPARPVRVLNPAPAAS